jgi:hypothetical protein
MINPLISLHNTWKTSGFSRVCVTCEGFFLLLGAGGEGGIRTPDTLASITVFETAAFNRSATSPCVRDGGVASPFALGTQALLRRRCGHRLRSASLLNAVLLGFGILKPGTFLGCVQGFLVLFTAQ